MAEYREWLVYSSITINSDQFVFKRHDHPIYFKKVAMEYIIGSGQSYTL